MPLLDAVGCRRSVGNFVQPGWAPEERSHAFKRSNLLIRPASGGLSALSIIGSDQSKGLEVIPLEPISLSRSPLDIHSFIHSIIRDGSGLDGGHHGAPHNDVHRRHENSTYTFALVGWSTLPVVFLVSKNGISGPTGKSTELDTRAGVHFTPLLSLSSFFFLSFLSL